MERRGLHNDNQEIFKNSENLRLDLEIRTAVNCTNINAWIKIGIESI